MEAAFARNFNDYVAPMAANSHMALSAMLPKNASEAKS
jgi:hypothetical protein